VVHLLAADLVAAGNQEGMSLVDTSWVDMRPTNMSQVGMHQVRHWEKVVAEVDIRSRLLRRNLVERSLAGHHNHQLMVEVEEVVQEVLEEGDSINTAGHNRWDSLSIQGTEQDHPWCDRQVVLEEQAWVGRVAAVASAGQEFQHHVWLLRQPVDAQHHHHGAHLYRLSSWRTGQ